MASELEAVCPACGECRITEFDPTLLQWHCGVCAATWRRPRGRHVPAPPRATPLPFTLTFDSEFEEDR
jgi:hypothetical protein